MSLDRFLTRATATHGDAYDYSKVVYTNNRTPVTIRCKKHDHWFAQGPNNHASGQGCPLCGKERQLAAAQGKSQTRAQFLAEVELTHGKRYAYADLPARIAKETKIRIVCPEHGEFTQQASVHRKGSGCRACSSKRDSLDSDAVLSEYRQHHPDLEFRTVYKGMHEPLTAYCTKHGFEFTRKGVHFRVRGCPKCGAERSAAAHKVTDHFIARNAIRSAQAKEYVKRWLTTSYTGGLVVDAESYRGRAFKMDAQCPKHGPVQVLFGNLLQQTGCRQCANEAARAPRLPFDQVNQRVRGRYADRIHLLEHTYTGVHDPVTAVCVDHGEFTTTAHALHGQAFGCPKCGNARTSQYETQLMDFVRGLGLEPLQSVWNVLPKTPKGGAQEIDVWVPECGVGIELHGLHFHAQTDDNPRRRHLEKWQAAQQVDIRLIQVFQDEWVDRREAVENRLRAILGKAARTYARKMKLTVQHGADCEAVAFLNRWHTQGAGRLASAYYGLEYEGELHAVLTAHRVVGDDGRWEISRYASKDVVVGGFSKLLRAFIKVADPSQILSYCDLRYGDGHGYEANGFEFVHTTDPDWWWIPSKNTQRRVARQASQARNIHRTPELEAVRQEYPMLDGDAVALQAGWRRIFGVGSHLFALTLREPLAPAR